MSFLSSVRPSLSKERSKICWIGAESGRNDPTTAYRRCDPFALYLSLVPSPPSSSTRCRVGKMQKITGKRRGNGVACLNEKKKASKTQNITFDDGCGKSCESSLSALTKQIVSEVSETVVSLAVFIGDVVLFECIGIFIENSCADVTSILTSRKIAGSSDYVLPGDLRIEVRLPNDQIVIGWLHHCYFDYDLAVVNIRHARGFQEAHLSSSHCVPSNGEVLAVGRCFDSGMLKTADGIVTGNASDEICELKLSTYNINTDWIGCPLLDFDGNFVGMNLRRRGSGERTAFVPMKKIVECLGDESNQVGVGTKEAPFYVNEDLEFATGEVYFNTREEAFPPITSLAWA